MKNQKHISDMQKKIGADHTLDKSALHAALNVGYSFRCGILSAHTSEKRYKTFAWQTLAQLSCDLETIDILLSQLTDFILNLDKNCSRKIEVLPQGCPGLCRDECLAVSMIAASQQKSCPALKACGYALLETCSLEPSLNAAEKFGATLQKAGIFLSPHIVHDGLTLTLLGPRQKFFHA